MFQRAEPIDHSKSGKLTQFLVILLEHNLSDSSTLFLLLFGSVSAEPLPASHVDVGG